VNLVPVAGRQRRSARVRQSRQRAQLIRAPGQVKPQADPADENWDESGGSPPAVRLVNLVSWPYSRLLGRPLDAAELTGPGPYMTIQVGGPLEGFVALTADVLSQQVAVVSRWGSGSLRHEQNATGLDMETGEALAARWADKLAAGHEPVAA
jgi:hypothetical protein